KHADAVPALTSNLLNEREGVPFAFFLCSQGRFRENGKTSNTKILVQTLPLRDGFGIVCWMFDVLCTLDELQNPLPGPLTSDGRGRMVDASVALIALKSKRGESYFPLPSDGRGFVRKVSTQHVRCFPRFSPFLPVKIPPPVLQ